MPKTGGEAAFDLEETMDRPDEICPRCAAAADACACSWQQLWDHIESQDAHIQTLEEALGEAGGAARREAQELAGESVAQAVFHAVKAVTRRALGKGESDG